MQFLRDLAGLAARYLASRGVKYRQKFLDEEPLLFYARFLEFRRRRIAPAPRRVLVSRELAGSPKWADHEAALDDLAEASQRGDDLTCFQTANIEVFQKPDLLLSDWGIHHLHLGRRRAGKRLSKRSEDLLFVAFTASDELCFIDIRNHDSFSDIELLEIVESNWPEALSPFVMVGVQSTVQTPGDYEVLRNAGIQTIFPLSSGRVLAPPGGGLTAARSSATCMLSAQATARLLVQAEEVVQNHIDRVRAALKIASNEEIHLIEYRGSSLVVGPRDGRSGVEIPIHR